MPSVRGGVTNGNPPGAPPPSSIKQSYLRVGEDCMVYRYAAYQDTVFLLAI